MICRVLIFVIILGLNPWLYSQAIIRNDSLTIKTQLFPLWDILPPGKRTGVLIQGVSNNYEYPPKVNTKDGYEIIFSEDNKDSVVRLVNGIYIASIFVSHSDQLLLFCKNDTIKVYKDYEVSQILEYFGVFCKESKYTEKEIARILIQISTLFENSYYLNWEM